MKTCSKCLLPETHETIEFNKEGKCNICVQHEFKNTDINWNNKKLMLPYSLRKDYISFTDKKWDWRYQFNKDGSPDINNPSLYELLPSGAVKAHFCRQSEDKNSNL